MSIIEFYISMYYKCVLGFGICNLSSKLRYQRINNYCQIERLILFLTCLLSLFYLNKPWEGLFLLKIISLMKF